MNESKNCEFLSKQELKINSSKVKMPAESQWGRVWSYFRRGMGLRIFKSKTSRREGNVQKKGSSVTDEIRKCNNQPPKFESARRAAICSVMEEEDQRHGISLAELRRELITRYLLMNVELL